MVRGSRVCAGLCSSRSVLSTGTIEVHRVGTVAWIVGTPIELATAVPSVSSGEIATALGTLLPVLEDPHISVGLVAEGVVAAADKGTAWA